MSQAPCTRRQSAASRHRTVIALVVVAAAVWCAYLGHATSTAQAATPVWDLGADFQIAPDQVNPNPDSLGHDRVWYFLQSATLEHRPSDYSLLPSFIDDFVAVPGLEAWHGEVADPVIPNAFLPEVGINAGPDAFPLGFQWPHGAVVVHPLPDRNVVVGWRSPVTALVRVDG